MLNSADSKYDGASDEKGSEATAGQTAVTTAAPGSTATPDEWAEAAQAWLEILCDGLDGASRGVVFLPGGSGPAGKNGWKPAAQWPAAGGDLSRLLAVATAAYEKGQTVVRPHSPKGSVAGAPTGETGSDDVHDVACPVAVGDDIGVVVSLEVAGCSEELLRGLVGELQSRATDLATLLRIGLEEEKPAPRGAMESALWLVAICLEHERFRGAATALATEMATQLDCERVSIGSVDGLQVEVQALSHSADFGDKMNLIRCIGAAMDEAVDQRASIVVPPPPGTPVAGTTAHEELIEEEGSGAACTVLLPLNDEIIGAITLERPGQRPFRAAEVQTLEDTAALLGPILELKRRDDRWLVRKAWDSLRAQAQKLFGPKHIGLKAAATGAVALIAFMALATGTFRATAPATLEGEVVRAAVAPMDGYIVDAPVRAGEVVERGDLLAILDDRVLRLEQRNWRSQRDQIESEYLEAMAEGERVEMNSLRANLEQAEVQLDLIQQQLDRMRIAAPIDGLVVSGDLSQSIGAPVEQGEVLFEVAPLDSYRLMLQVDERDIAYIQPGQRGRVVLSALPETTHEFTVEKVTPVSTSEEGTTFFLVEARLDEASELLRPGMEGIGKVDVDEARLIWIWTRRVTDWLRLWYWSWFGPGT